MTAKQLVSSVYYQCAEMVFKACLLRFLLHCHLFAYEEAKQSKGEEEEGATASCFAQKLEVKKN